MGATSPTSIPICLETKKPTEPTLQHVITHMEEAVENREFNTWSFPR
jgi:hypothetical protein